MNTYETIALSIVILVIVVYRQLRTRPVIGGRVFVMPLVFGVLGAFSTVSFIAGGGAPQTGIVLAVVGGLVLAAGLAYPRATSMKIWRGGDGVWMCRGTVVTLAWWVVTVAAHIGVSLLVPPLFGERGSITGGLESATIGLYAAVTLGIQILVRWRRAVGSDTGTAQRVRESV